jgi:hypothetical protein
MHDHVVGVADPNRRVRDPLDVRAARRDQKMKAHQHPVLARRRAARRERWMRGAGFEEIGAIWRHYGTALIVAIRCR